MKETKLAIIGSAKGGGAAQVIDATNETKYNPVAIFDNDINTHHTKVLGVPVLGDSDIETILFHYSSKLFDEIIIAIGGNLWEREKIFKQLQDKNIPIANVIDPTVQLRSEVKIGIGNVILGNVYLGPYVEIGNNCYIINNTTIQHHSKIGHHCYFSTSVALAGRVIVGERVRFDTRSGVKADITIGDNSYISAGCLITHHIDANTLVEPINYKLTKI